MNRRYYWLTGINEGKRFLISAPDATSEDQARAYGLETLAGVDFVVKCLHTSNIAQASRELKGHILKKGHNLSQATHRLGHNRTLRRSRLKREARRGSFF